MDSRKNLRPVLVACLMVVVAAVSYGLARQNPPAPPVTEMSLPSLTVQTPSPAVAISDTASVDQLIEALTQIRKQKQDIERKEQAVVQRLQEKLQDQQLRLRKLGIDGGQHMPAQGIPQPIPDTPIAPARGI